MTETNTVEHLNLDPATLLVDMNIRHTIKLDSEFIASIKELGVLVPVQAVRTADGEVRVRFGHRRTLAAVEAGRSTIPVDVMGDESDSKTGQIERIITQHAENEHRSNLTAGEKVDVVNQLSMLGVKATEIAKKTRIAKDDVQAATKVAGSELAKAAAERYDFLTLEQAAAVAEFEDDDDAVKALVAGAQTGRFEHVVERLRQDRAEDEAIAEAVAELVKQGVTVIDRPAYSERVITTLTVIRRTAKTLTDQAHAECPGHAAFVEVYFDDNDEDDAQADATETGQWITEATYVCTDPVQYGHLKSAGSAAKDATSGDTTAQDKADEAAREERRRVIANNKAWKAATTTRRKWLTEFLARKTAPKDAQRYVIREMADPGSAYGSAMDRRHATACELLGVEQPSAPWQRRHGKGSDLLASLDAAPDARADVIALALVLGAYEGTLGDGAWRRPQSRDGRYLSRLAAWGYGLSEIESQVIDATTETDD